MKGMITKETTTKVLNVLKAIYPDAMSRSGIHLTTQVHNYSVKKVMPELVRNGWVEEIKLKRGRAHAVYRWRGAETKK